jgi:hypothetical protein
MGNIYATVASGSIDVLIAIAGAVASWNVAIPPTCWLLSGGYADLGTLLADNGWDKAVVKPVISATAYQTWHTTCAQAHDSQPRFAAGLQQSDMLVQQFMDPIVTDGETNS